MMSTPTVIQILVIFEYRTYLHINTPLSSSLWPFTMAIKAHRPRKPPCLPTAGQSLFSLGSPFCWGKKKEGNKYVILFLSGIFTIVDSPSNTYFISLWEKVQFSKEGQKGFFILLPQQWHFKKWRGKKKTKLAAHRILHENKIATEFTKIKAEMQLFSAHPSFTTQVSKDRHQCHRAVNSKVCSFTWRKE